MLWGAPRIHSELLKLGIKVSEASVAKYMVRHSKPPSQTWRAFLANHVSQMVSVDFFTVRTIWFETLFVFVVSSADDKTNTNNTCNRAVGTVRSAAGLDSCAGIIETSSV